MGLGTLWVPGGRSAVLNATDKKRRMRQEQRPWTCLSGVAVHLYKSHSISTLEPKPHCKGFQRGRGGEEAAAGVNKGGMTLSQRECLWGWPAGHFTSGFNKTLKAEHRL